MSEPPDDKNDTLPAMRAAPRTQPASWQGPVTELQDRLDRLEDSHRQLRSMAREHREENVLFQTHAERRVGTLEYDVGELKTNVTEIKSEMGSQTKTLAELKEESKERTETLKRIETLLKPFGSVFSHPRVQTALVALVLAAIAALTAWLTSKGHVSP